MIALAFLGLAVNGFAAWRVSKGTSLSERMIVWHLIEDVMGWALVLIGALVMRYFGYPQIDAALGCVLAIWILVNVARNLKESFMVFLQVVPAHMDLPQIEKEITTIAGIKAIHHSHLWSLDGEQHIFTTHLVVEENLNGPAAEKLKRAVKDLLANKNIMEATLELEPEGTDCVDPTHGKPKDDHDCGDDADHKHGDHKH
jgi:cobalt-zinc-cadmium efflux system protein